MFRNTQQFFQLNDGGQFLFVEERSKIHDTMYMYLERERPQTFRKQTDKLSYIFSLVRAGFEPTLSVGERPGGRRPMS
jgi:hypothetical protein